MNVKIYSLLVMIFLGLSLGFTSCSDDDDDNENSSSYEAGKKAGNEFLAIYDACKNSEKEVEIIDQAPNFYLNYQKYKKNKTNSEWKKGFLEGAASAEASKYETLSALLDKDWDFSNIYETTKSIITELEKILG